MTKRATRLLLLSPFLIAAPLYTLDLLRIISLSPLLFAIAACLLVALLAYVAIMFFATSLSFLLLEDHRWVMLTSTIAGLLLAAGSLFPIGYLVKEKQDKRFLKRLAEYQRAVALIERRGEPKENGWRSLGKAFPSLANEVRVLRDPASGIQVYFMAYPRFLRKNLRGYAYNSTDSWTDSFIKVYGQPKRLTNNWYRI
jgi:hypothetical protein